MKTRRCARYMVGRKRSKPCQHTADGNSHGDTIGSAASLEHGDAGLIPSPAQWVKDLLLPQPQCRLQTAAQI